MVFRTLLIVTAVCGLCFTGCAKKPKQPQTTSAQAPAVVSQQAEAPASTPKKDTADVFNDYYKDTKGKKVDKTFSMKPSTGADSYVPEFSANGRYAVQIGAGPSSAGAEDLAYAFKSKGYPAYVAEVQNPTTELAGTYYRVRIGGFHTIADATAFGENILRPANYDYWVDLRANDAVGTGTGYSSGYSESYTPSYTPSTPSAPATTTDYGSSSSTGASTYDWNAPASTTPSYEPSPATTPAAETQTSTPSYATDTTASSTGSWEGSGW